MALTIIMVVACWEFPFQSQSSLTYLIAIRWDIRVSSPIISIRTSHHAPPTFFFQPHTVSKILQPITTLCRAPQVFDLFQVMRWPGAISCPYHSHGREHLFIVPENHFLVVPSLAQNVITPRAHFDLHAESDAASTRPNAVSTLLQ